MRVNHHDMMFESSVIKDLYLTVVQAAKRKYRFKIDNFCIMNNHIHLLIQPGKDANLSRIMQWINGVFAMRYNRVMGIDGHFWGERFFSIVLTSLKDYLRTLEYIDQNPVMAHLVRSPVGWLFGGARHSKDGRYDILDEPDFNNNPNIL